MESPLTLEELQILTGLLRKPPEKFSEKHKRAYGYSKELFGFHPVEDMVGGDNFFEWLIIRPNDALPHFRGIYPQVKEDRLIAYLLGKLSVIQDSEGWAVVFTYTDPRENTRDQVNHSKRLIETLPSREGHPNPGWVHGLVHDRFRPRGFRSLFCTNRGAK